MKAVVWHLVNEDDTIVRSTQATHRDEARVRLAPIGQRQFVVSAASYAVKESQELQTMRRARCNLCGEPMSHEPASIYSTTHRSCYQRQWRENMSPDQRAAFLEKRRGYHRRSRDDT